MTNSDLIDIISITRGRMQRGCRAVVFWTFRSLVICPNLKAGAVERTERAIHTSGSTHASNVDEAGRPLPRDIVGWLRHCDPECTPTELPLGALVDVEWRQRRSVLVVRAGDEKWRIKCGSRNEAQKEFETLQAEAEAIITSCRRASSGLPRGIFLWLMGMALLVTPLLIDINLIFDPIPTEDLPPAVLKFLMEAQDPSRWALICRGAMSIGLLLAAVGGFLMIFKNRSENLVLADSSTPLTIKE